MHQAKHPKGGVKDKGMSGKEKLLRECKATGLGIVVISGSNGKSGTEFIGELLGAEKTTGTVWNMEGLDLDGNTTLNDVLENDKA